MTAATQVKIIQCQNCLGLFAEVKGSPRGRYRFCQACRTPVALAAFGYGYEDLMVQCRISREQAKAIVFGRRKTEAS
jgi:hypothetical protein